MFKKQAQYKKQREKYLIESYDRIHTAYQKRLDRYENSNKKRQRDLKHREIFEKLFPEIRKQREEKERLAQKQKAAAER